ncbi:MAG: LacI family DNA-binding transcriptional regulator [Anaerolineae bacterium]|nr:LacI family DNA-binding transcriptional regulator [Anaerolineae bacterium]
MHSRSRTTIDDVAREAKVSTATISRYLNDPDKVAIQTRAVIAATIQRLQYQPNQAARVLASNHNTVIGLVVDEIGGEFFSPMLHGIEKATSQHGYDLLILSAHGKAKVGEYPINEHNTAGLVVFANSLPEAELRRLHRIGFPVVLLHRSSPPDIDIPFVTVANHAGAREMTDYLIEQRGYRRIAFLEGEAGSEDAQTRLQGYRDSLEVHGLGFDPLLIGAGGFSEQTAHDTVMQWLRRGLKIEAIFAADDDSAIGAMSAITERGLRVPQDIAVVGFDDTRLARYLTPPLTTVRMPIEHAGRLAVEHLVQVIQTGSTEQRTLLPTELIIRASCGCC